jgi:outer membrane protein assembly factor BamA
MRLLRVLVFLPTMFWGITICLAQEKQTGADSTHDSLSEIVAQQSMQLIVGDVVLTGNKRTRASIVMREIPFRAGARYTLKGLEEAMLHAHDQLMNTSLFVDVAVYIGSQKGNIVRINVDVKERWYFFPLPYFRLVDRNFNQWWVEQKRSLERVNYGIKFTQNNLTGRNDNLDVWLISGYNHQLTLRYDIPFFDKQLKSGLNIGIIAATQKEMNYATGDNKQLFYKAEADTRKTFHLDMTYSYRPDVKQRHYYRVSYNDEQVADTILKMNPAYFPEHRTRLQYLDFLYQYKYYNADLISYPTNGILFEGNLYRRGLDKVSGYWQVSTRTVLAKPIAKNAFVHLEALTALKAPFREYFVNERLFGYGHFQLRGQEYNVVDGMIGAALKTAVHKQVLSFIFKNPFPSKTHDKIPFRIFLKAYGDLGYAYTPHPDLSNTLNNKLMRTWGFGLDIVSIYDFVFKIEYSFNQLGRDGLYLQTRNDF